MKQLINTILISIIALLMIAHYVPMQSQQAYSCECCKSSACGCGCNHNRTSSKTPLGTDIPACDFNKCNGNLPFNASASVFVTSSFTESTKRLGSSIGLNIVKEVIYPSISFPEKPLFIGHLLSPPPAFLLNSCFIL